MSNRIRGVREFEFTVRYEAGVDDLMDVFIEYPQLKAKTTTCFATERKMWRIDYAFGPEAAIERLDGIFLDESVCNECLDLDRCDETSSREYHVLDSGAEHRLYYTRRDEIAACHSLPYLSVEHIGDGVLLEAERRETEYTWRLLMPERVAVGELYDAVEERLRPGLSLELGHVREMTGWNAQSEVAGVLSTAERETVEAAVEHGYYETPRGVTVTELGELLDTPRSTVQYRLQRAEQKIVEEFAENSL